MITFRRAIVFAAAFLTLFFIVKSHHGDHRQHITADKMPRPGPWKAPGSKEEPKSRPEQAQSAPITSSAVQPKKARPQIPLADLQKKPLRARLEYQFPYDPQSKFPAYIWQTWKYTPADGKFDEAFREPEASWTIHHPTFVHEVITDGTAFDIIKLLYASVPEVKEAYEALPLPVLKADFFRYLILLARGGIYSDIDTQVIRPATEWVPPAVDRSTYGMVIGIEADPDRPDWKQWYSRRIQFCQWTIQSKPGHPILRNIVANITEETLKRKRSGALNKNSEALRKDIVEFTGPALWTDTIFDFFNDPEVFDMSSSKANITFQDFTGMKTAKKVGDVVVLPITSFSPGVKTMGAGEDDDEMAFVKHLFEGTWKPESERHIGEQKEE